MSHPLWPALEALTERISQRCYASGWMSGIEDFLTEAIAAPPSPKPITYGLDVVDPDEVVALKALRAQGVWFQYPEADPEDRADPVERE